ncbi:hypothetical protein Tco_0781992 [Tanacetum coccineum]
MNNLLLASQHLPRRIWLGEEKSQYRKTEVGPRLTLQEYCDKNYNQLLLIIAKKFNKEKEKNEKPKEVKARLNFGGSSKTSRHIHQHVYDEWVSQGDLMNCVRENDIQLQGVHVFWMNIGSDLKLHVYVQETSKAEKGMVVNFLYMGRFQGMVKGYCGVLRLGEATSTLYDDSPVIQPEPWEHIKDDDIKKTAATFCREI